MSALRTPSPIRSSATARRGRRRAVIIGTLVAAVTATLTGAPAPAAEPGAAAHPGCLLVAYESVSWQDSPGTGGVYTTITITNTCGEAVTDWTLLLTLAPGHELQQGWNAHWEVAGAAVTATGLVWNRVLEPAGSVTIGYLGTWVASPRDPVACAINGEPCPGWETAAEVTLTGPTDGQIIPTPCPVTLTAEPVGGSGEIERVDYYVNQEWVGTVETAPYRLVVPSNHPVLDHVGANTALARAVGSGGDSDSASVTFHLAPMPPALMVVGCTPTYTLAPGETAVVSFQAACSGEPAMTFQVSGEATVTVSPQMVAPGDSYHEVTVTVAPDSPLGSATVSAIPDEVGCMSGSTLLQVS